MNETEAGFDVTVARAHCNAASEGPWGAADEHGEIESNEVNRAWCVSKMHTDSSWSHDIAYLSTDYGDPVGDQERADAEFIAYARTALPAALDLIEAQQAVLDQVAVLCDIWSDYGEVAVPFLRAALSVLPHPDKQR